MRAFSWDLVPDIAFAYFFMPRQPCSAFFTAFCFFIEEFGVIPLAGLDVLDIGLIQFDVTEVRPCFHWHWHVHEMHSATLRNKRNPIMQGSCLSHIVSLFSEYVNKWASEIPLELC